MKPFGKTRKQMAFVILAIGLLTFTVPLVSTTPPVMGRTQWSAWNIAAQVYARKLPVPDGRFDEALVEIALIYLLMLFALVALCFPRSEKPVRFLAGVGFAISSLAKFWRFGFVQTFYGYFGHTRNWHVGAGPAWFVLPFIMPALLLVSFRETLDA